MAEEGKLQFKPVNVTIDAEGNPVVKAIEPKPPVEEEKPEGEPAPKPETPETDEPEADTPEADEPESDDTPEADEPEGDDSPEPEADEPEEDQPTEEDEPEEVVDYEELPEAVQAYLDFHEETGGSLQEFIEANRDFDSLPQDQVIREYLKKTNPYLDEDDIDYEIESRFGIDKDADSDAEIRAKKVAKKKFYGEAIASLKEQGAKFKADLGSSKALPQQAREALKFRQDFEAQQAANAKALQSKIGSFVKETNKVLGKDFKGFEVKVGDKSLVYKPSDIRKVKEQNLNVNNLLGKFTDKEGNVKDVAGYHRALTFASDPDAVAAHFFELGKAAAIEDDVKGSKNINMNPRQVQQPKNNSKQKFKFVDVEPSMSKNAKIKLRNY